MPFGKSAATQSSFAERDIIGPAPHLALAESLLRPLPHNAREKIVNSRDVAVSFIGYAICAAWSTLQQYRNGIGSNGPASRPVEELVCSCSALCKGQDLTRGCFHGQEKPPEIY